MAPAHAVTRLIVLPFRVLRPDPETDFLAFSLADASTSSLVRPAVAGRPLQRGASRFASDAPDLKAIATEAEVDAVLVGTHAARRRSTPRDDALVDAPAATVLWSHTAQVPVGDLFRLQDELTSRIVESLSTAAHRA